MGHAPKEKQHAGVMGSMVEAREEALAAIGDEINQCLQIIVTNAGNWPSGERMYPNEVKEAHNCCSAIHKAVERAAAVVQKLALPADAPESSERDEFAAVRVSAPTLTLTRKEVGEGLGWTSDKTGVYIPWDDFPKVADRLNTILAAKSQRGVE